MAKDGFEFPFVVAFLFVLAWLSGGADARTLNKSSRRMSSGSDLLSALMGSSKSGGNFNIGLRQDYLLQDCSGPGFKQSFPDIDYSLFGYNVLRGYPLADGHDPGFTLPIFVADYTDLKHTADCRYSLPNGLVVVPDVSCDISFTSKITQSANQFESALSASAKVNGGGWGVSFSASAEYKKASSVLSSGEYVYILSTASCTQYFSKLIPRASPELDPIFSQWIETLRGTDDANVYFQFFDTFGTHFPTMVTYGAKFSQENKMTSQTYEKKKEEGVNVAVEASYSGLFSIGGGFGLDSSQRQQASDFQKSVETKTVTVGAAPPSNGDAMTWASNVKNSPVPVKYKLESIENIFSYLKPNTITNVQKVITNIRKFKGSYYNKLVTPDEINTHGYQTPGLELKGTRLVVGDDSLYTKSQSFSECINECKTSSYCFAVSYCENCAVTSNSYKRCFLFNPTFLFRSATSDDEWWSYIMPNRITTPLTMEKTFIIGTPMTAGKFFKAADVKKDACQNMCEKAAICSAFSYRTSGSWKCTLYDANKIKRLDVETDSSVTIIRVI